MLGFEKKHKRRLLAALPKRTEELELDEILAFAPIPDIRKASYDIITVPCCFRRKAIKSCLHSTTQPM